MKVLVQYIETNSVYAKVFKWGKLVTITGLAQVLVKVIGFVSGILVVRLLPTHEYALYTLVNTMLGVMTILADGGIATGVTAQGRKVWQDRVKLGAVLATGLDLRKKFAIFSLIVAIPILFYQLRLHSASGLMSVLIIVSLIPAFFTTLSGRILEIAPLFRQDIVSLQKNQVGVNLGRFIILVITLFAFPWAFVAILAAGIPQIWANINLRKISLNHADWQQNADPIIRKEILAVVKRILPGSIYYCISGQITIWIISFFGSTLAIAQIGGLSRLTVALSFFTSLFSTLIVPRFARFPSNQLFIIKRFFLIQLGLISISIFIISVVNIFPENILWILGSDYIPLTKELVLITISSCLSLISANTNQLLTARGIIMPPALFISLIIAVQVGLVFIVQLNELSGVLLYSIYTTLAIYFTRVIYLIFALTRNEVY